MSEPKDPRVPSDEQLATMSRDELVRLGLKLDDVELVEYDEPWPVKGTRAERRAEKIVAGWFALGLIAAIAFIVIYIAWPWQYRSAGHQALYLLYTPLLGVTLGLAVLSLGVGVITYVKKFVPHEVAVQQRHDGPSDEVDRQTTVALLSDAGNRSTIARRSLIFRTAGAAAGVFGLTLVVLPLGGLIKNPWANSNTNQSLWHTGWYEPPGPTAERVYLRKDTGNPNEIALVSPADMDAGSMQTVFPFRESERGNPEKLQAALTESDNPVMLIRLRPEDAANVIKRKGQEDFNYGDYYAYTKICSHLGCPTSLFEQQTNRILCSCHQSQFNALEYCKPIFGPATRALAQLPIEVDATTGYFYARHDFIEAVGPAFWERSS